jgi:hypothetical protein
MNLVTSSVRGTFTSINFRLPLFFVNIDFHASHYGFLYGGVRHPPEVLFGETPSL